MTFASQFFSQLQNTRSVFFFCFGIQAIILSKENIYENTVDGRVLECVFAYPIYQDVLKKELMRIAPEIFRPSDELAK